MFLIGLFAVVGLLIVFRFTNRRNDLVLKQYETLVKRFTLKRKTTPTKWGAGIGERFTLKGDFRGYPISIYSHYNDRSGKKQEWTSLVVEILFAEQMAFDVVFDSSQEAAKFNAMDVDYSIDAGEGIAFKVNRKDAQDFVSEKLLERLAVLTKKETCGVLRLSKGFLEYRETGVMTSEEMRIRFQDALLLSAELADLVSVFVAENR